MGGSTFSKELDATETEAPAKTADAPESTPAPASAEEPAKNTDAKTKLSDDAPIDAPTG